MDGLIPCRSLTSPSLSISLSALSPSLLVSFFVCFPCSLFVGRSLCCSPVVASMSLLTCSPVHRPSLDSLKSPLPISRLSVDQVHLLTFAPDLFQPPLPCPPTTPSIVPVLQRSIPFTLSSCPLCLSTVVLPIGLPLFDDPNWSRTHPSFPRVTTSPIVGGIAEECPCDQLISPDCAISSLHSDW
jgi:hypothetical protein